MPGTAPARGTDLHAHSASTTQSSTRGAPVGLIWGLLMAAAGAAIALWRKLRNANATPENWNMCNTAQVAVSPSVLGAPVETLVRSSVEGAEGVYCCQRSPLAHKVLTKVPSLAQWSKWYKSPLWAKNGHVHTIIASKARRTAAVEYHRTELSTPDGGTLALDRLITVRWGERPSNRQEGVTFVGPASEAWEQQNRNKPFLLLTSGLGGGSHDPYVRSMAASAAAKGWQVGIVNMRSCGGSPVTSARFFSAYRGSTCDVRQALAHCKQHFVAPGTRVAVMGWSNGGTIINNLLAEQATTHFDDAHRVDAGVTLATPLNMPGSSKHLQRWFQRHVYDRAIASNLVNNFSQAQHLFEGEVDTWDGGKCTIDSKALLQCTTIEGIDHELTRKSFGFETVADYYSHASSDQRLKDVDVPLLLLSAIDDPIAPGHCIPWHAARENQNLVMAVTKHGGHLGWCDKDDPFNGCKWVEEASLSFLGAALDH